MQKRETEQQSEPKVKDSSEEVTNVIATSQQSTKVEKVQPQVAEEKNDQCQTADMKAAKIVTTSEQITTLQDIDEQKKVPPIQQKKNR